LKDLRTGRLIKRPSGDPWYPSQGQATRRASILVKEGRVPHKGKLELVKEGR